MDYNTNRPKLLLPEYGRHLQQMAEVCRGIPDRDERNACAYTLVSILSRLFPEEMKGTDISESKAWDTLQMLAGFDLDVDFPCQVISQADVRPKPDTVPYNREKILLRHYGLGIQRMARAVAALPDGPEKDEGVWRVAMHMKKELFMRDPDGTDDSIVLRDLEYITDGAIQLTPETYPLRDFVPLPEPAQTGKKKKKKKK